MKTIPPVIETLLKGKAAIGNYRPTGTLTIAGQGIPGNLKDPANWTTWRDFTTSGKANGNITETADNRCVVVYCESNVFKMAFAASVAGILNGTESFDYGNAVTIKTPTGATLSQASIVMIDGKLNVVLSWYKPTGGSGYNPGTCFAELWRDTDGNGTGMAKVSDIVNGTVCSDLGWLSLLHKLPGGALVVCSGYGYNFGGEAYMYYSSDNGASWAKGAGVPFGYYLARFASMSFLVVGDTSFITTTAANNGTVHWAYWTNSGANVTTSPDWGTWAVTPVINSFTKVDDKYYMAAHYESGAIKISELNSAPPTQTNGNDEVEWTLRKTLASDGYQTQENMHVTESALIIQHSVGNKISGAGTDVAPAYSIPIKSITIDRTKGSASQATIVLDNKDGMYAPDNADSDWFQVIWLNKLITVTVGYGEEQEQVFYGMIDTVEVESFPAQLTIYARDLYKMALDQKIFEGSGDNKIYAAKYTNKTPEFIYADLAVKAGWAADKVHTEITGMTLSEHQFGHENVADGFQALIDITQFESVCDEIGELYFRPALEPDPAAVYVLREGEDIFGLTYRFSDEELYRDIVVWATDGDKDNPQVVKAKVTWSAADYNNLLPNKTLIVNASSVATTQGQCETIAQRLANAMTPKPRMIRAYILGHPYLQMGDCIQVVESTTKASEIYRIQEMTQELDSDGNPVFATTVIMYHYAYAAIPEEVPEEYVEPDTPPSIPDTYEGETYPVYPGGGVDVTADIQAQIDAAYAAGGGTVYLPAGDYWIDVDTSIKLKSGVNLTLHENATLYAIPASTSTNAVILGYDVSNITIQGGKIIGDKNTHLGSGGEHGMGIWLGGCRNVVIKDIEIYNCWGDGIYLGNGAVTNHNYNVLIENFVISNCRRNGIGVISNKWLTVRNGTISYIDGDDPTYMSLPQDGIDVEPNTPADWMYKLVFENITTLNCQGFGIALTFWWYDGSSNPVDVLFSGCSDAGSLRNDVYDTGEDPYIENYEPSSTCIVTIS